MMCGINSVPERKLLARFVLLDKLAVQSVVTKVSLALNQKILHNLVIKDHVDANETK